ncbi:MAG: hypothetical protein HYX68_00885 [Planctomycetes bacterium]|nr:hypothetical protein [Planctomycetota bacterium]
MPTFASGLIQKSEGCRVLPFVKQSEDVVGRFDGKDRPESDASLFPTGANKALSATKRVVPFNFDSAQTLMRSNSNVTIGHEIS